LFIVAQFLSLAVIFRSRASQTFAFEGFNSTSKLAKSAAKTLGKNRILEVKKLSNQSSKPFLIM
jgi:hypothetical protein